MPRYAVDTNVLVVASIQANAKPSSHHVPAAERIKVLERVKEFRNDPDAVMVLDRGEDANPLQGVMYQEYGRYLTENTYGRMVLIHKRQQGCLELVGIRRSDGTIELPTEVKRSLHEPTDQAVAASAYCSRRKGTTVLNACDSDWVGLTETQLAAHGVRVDQIIREWLYRQPKSLAKLTPEPIRATGKRLKRR